LLEGKVQPRSCHRSVEVVRPSAFLPRVRCPTDEAVRRLRDPEGEGDRPVLIVAALQIRAAASRRA
jgi:hypothetical protein